MGLPEGAVWCDAVAFEAAWSLADEAEAAGNGVEAAKWARRAVSFTPNDEAAFRRLLELLDRLGDRSGAIQEYESFGKWVGREYETEPSAETQALIARIRDTSGQEVKPAESLNEEAAVAGPPTERSPRPTKVGRLAATDGVARGEGSKRADANRSPSDARCRRARAPARSGRPDH